MKLFTTLLLSVFALCSCAQMTVNVSILDRKFWSSPEQLSNSISMQVAEVAMNRGNGTFAHGHMKIKALTRQALLDLAKAGQLDPNDVERLARLLSNFVDNGFKEAAEHFERAFKLLVTASEVPPPNDRLAILFKAQSELDAGRATMIGVEEQISADLRRQVSAAKNGSRTQAVRILNEAQSKIQKNPHGSDRRSWHS